MYAIAASLKITESHTKQNSTGSQAMTPELIDAIAEGAAKLIAISMGFNALLKIVVWHFTEGTKP